MDADSEENLKQFIESLRLFIKAYAITDGSETEIRPPVTAEIKTV